MELADFLCTPGGITIFLGVLLVWLLWWSSRRGHDVWKNMGIACIPPAPLLGSLMQNIKKPLHEAELARYNEYGRIYGYYEGNNPLISVGDPRILRNILVKDFHCFSHRRIMSTGDPIGENMINNMRGEAWKRVRTIITPAFTTGKIKRMLNIFKSCSKVSVQNFKTYAEKGEPVDAKSIYGAFAMDVIASAAFSTKLDSHNDPENIFVIKAKSVFGKFNWRFILYILFPRLMKLFKMPVFPPEGSQFFSQVTRSIIQERKKTGKKGDDFLQILMDTADEVEDKSTELEKGDNILRHYEEESNDQVLKDFRIARKSLSLDELVSQCVIFFLAGYETTASLLSFATYYLALNPDLRERLATEVDDTIRANDGELTYEAVQNMKYLDSVISETLRINAPAVRLERVATEDYKVEGTDIVIPKGAIVSVPVMAIHHDPEFYKNPETFDPDRFNEERVPYSYLPFGAGPRNCVGMRFALVEAKVCLAYVLAHFRINRCPQTKVPLEYKKKVQALLQPTDVTVVMETRKNCPLDQ